MDSALILLYRLRIRAYFRNYARKLRTARGAVTSLLGFCMLVFWIWSTSRASRPGGPPVGPDVLLNVGPPILLAYTTMMLLFGVENAIVFSPPEIEFLFAGPYTRRQLLAYKIAGLTFGILISSIFMTFMLRNLAANIAYAYVGVVCVLLTFQLLAMALNLASSTITLFARSARRRVLLGGLMLLLAATAWSVLRGVKVGSPQELFNRVSSSIAFQVAIAPFRPFVAAAAAGSFWPDFLAPLALCLVIIGVLAVLVFLLDAQFLESSAASSQALYARIAQVRKGGVISVQSTSKKPVKSRMKMLPWLGGAGPTLWRQLLTARRQPTRIAIPILVSLVPLVVVFLMRDEPEKAVKLVAFLYAFLGAYLAFLASAVVGFDFRSEVERMSEIKALPLSPISVVLGQLATPVVLLSTPTFVSAAVAFTLMGSFTPENILIIALTLPFNILTIEIDNLLFLLMPVRTSAASPADFSAFGRQMVIIFVKVIVLGVCAGAAAAVGFGFFFLVVHTVWPALAVSFVIGMIFAAGMVPLLAKAYERFDVVRDAPT